MAINKVILDGQTVLDLTETTVTPDAMASGVTALDSTATLVTGRSIAQASGTIRDARYGVSILKYVVRDDVVTLYGEDLTVGYFSDTFDIPEDIRPNHNVFASCAVTDSDGNEYANGAIFSIAQNGNATLGGITGKARFTCTYIRGVS